MQRSISFLKMIIQSSTLLFVAIGYAVWKFRRLLTNSGTQLNTDVYLIMEAVSGKSS